MAYHISISTHLLSWKEKWVKISDLQLLALEIFNMLLGTSGCIGYITEGESIYHIRPTKYYYWPGFGDLDSWNVRVYHNIWEILLWRLNPYVSLGIPDTSPQVWICITERHTLRLRMPLKGSCETTNGRLVSQKKLPNTNCTFLKFWFKRQFC